MTRQPSRFPVLVLTLSLAIAAPLGAAEPEVDPGAGAGILPDVYREWLEMVAPLIHEEERAVFLKLTEDYQRQAFVRRFWQVRDPFPRTGLNEFRQRWERRVQLARQRYGNLAEDRARMLMLVGEPESITQTRCTNLMRPLELWYYSRRDKVDSMFYLVFLAETGVDSYRLWHGSLGLAKLQDRLVAHRRTMTLAQENAIGLPSNRDEAQHQYVGLPSPSRGLHSLSVTWSGREQETMGLVLPDSDFLQFVAFQCPRGDAIVTALRRAIDPIADSDLFQHLLEPPGVWVPTFYSYAARPETGPERFDHLEQLISNRRAGAEETAGGPPILVEHYSLPGEPPEDASAAEHVDRW